MPGTDATRRPPFVHTATLSFALRRSASALKASVPHRTPPCAKYTLDDFASALSSPIRPNPGHDSPRFSYEYHSWSRIGRAFGYTRKPSAGQSSSSGTPQSTMSPATAVLNVEPLG